MTEPAEDDRLGVWERLLLIVLGFGVGSGIAGLLAVRWLGPAPVSYILLFTGVWAAGPVLGSWWGIAGHFPVVYGLGWFGLLLMLVHPLRTATPNDTNGLPTAAVTVLGFLFWFLAGYFTAVIGLVP